MLQSSILGPLLFLVYINDVPTAKGNKAIPVLFADDTSILITSPNNVKFQSDFNVVFGQLNKWFMTNLLSLNFDKTYVILFTNKVHVLLTYKLHMKLNKCVHLLKQNFLSYLLKMLFLGKHTLSLN